MENSDCSTLFFFPYLLRAQNMFRAIEGKLPCDLKGNKNLFELSEGSNYRARVRVTDVKIEVNI